jgi:hypothetical protein
MIAPRLLLLVSAFALSSTVACVSERKVDVKPDGGEAGGDGGSSRAGRGGQGGQGGSSRGGEGGSAAAGSSAAGGSSAAVDGGDDGGPALDLDASVDAGSGGDPLACDPPCSGETPICEQGACVGCMNGSARCTAGDTPEVCEQAAWVKRAPCSGTTPACSNGVCGTVRMSGGLVTVQQVSTTGTTVQLLEQSVEYVGRSCGTVNGAEICVTGGLKP